MADTPMMKQYKEIKGRHEDCILFFRMGDFYEMFFEDAYRASRILEISLTARNKSDDVPIPMCGIPYHSAANYIPKLVSKGYKVAVCEQIEDPSASKGITKRDVVKIITPGTVTELNMLDSKHNNYLMSVFQEKIDENNYGISYVDISTGDFYVSEICSKRQLLDEIARVNPAELLISRDLADEIMPTVTYYEPENKETSRRELEKFFKVNSLESFGCEMMHHTFPAAKAIVDYIVRTQKSHVNHINRITPYLSGRYMFFDSATRRNLELTTTLRDKQKDGSLVWVLDETHTAMGGRLLLSWLNSPLLDHKELVFRQDAVEELFDNYSLRVELVDKLKNVYDIERLTTRVVSGSANPKELRSLCNSLKNIKEIKNVISAFSSKMLSGILTDENIIAADEIINIIDKAIVDEPSMITKDGGMIKEGYVAELDDIKAMAKDGKAWIASLEISEKEKTGIKNLKVGFNKVFGYYIEISKSNVSLAPDYYIRKQTLTNGERYITPELKEKESQILSSAERSIEMELKVFQQVRERIAKFVRDLQVIAKDIARLDVFLSFATVADDNGYVRPNVKPMDCSDGNIIIEGGRHPVIEKMIGRSNFIKNDVALNAKDQRFVILTGPNMSGKSTYMRQTALIVLMAQVGCFVPVDNAEITMVDRIFTRVGAMDDLVSGQSTFMVEMNETSNILHNATEHSLIILDEIGRGTSTYDGISIAGAVAEHINNHIKAKSIFATHYHELTILSSQYQGMRNYSIAVDEDDEQIVFMHKVIPGAADRSYGIHVAELAGLPRSVISRANELLYGLESNSADLEMEDVGVKKKKKSTNAIKKTKDGKISGESLKPSQMALF